MCTLNLRFLRLLAELETSSAERHGFDNLILMCSIHHSVVDDDWETYTAERLRRMKTDHEDHATPVSADEASSGGDLLLIQSVTTTNQSGGIAAAVVNAGNIHVHAAGRSEEQERRRAHAVSILWSAIVKLKEEFSSVTFVDNILSKHELEACFNGADSNAFFEMLLPFASQTTIMEKVAAAGGKAAEVERPFVSPRLYQIYFVTQAVLARSAFLIQLSFENDSFRDWRSDSGIAQLLGSVLPQSTIKSLRLRAVHGLTAVVDTLESEFLKEAQAS
jgi:hypothetical protein